MTTEGKNPAEDQTYLQKKSRVFRPTLRLSVAALAGFGLIAGILFLAGIQLDAGSDEHRNILCFMPHDAGQPL